LRKIKRKKKINEVKDIFVNDKIEENNKEKIEVKDDKDKNPPLIYTKKSSFSQITSNKNGKNDKINKIPKVDINNNIDNIDEEESLKSLREKLIYDNNEDNKKIEPKKDIINNISLNKILTSENKLEPQIVNDKVEIKKEEEKTDIKDIKIEDVNKKEEKVEENKMEEEKKDIKDSKVEEVNKKEEKVEENIKKEEPKNENFKLMTLGDMLKS